MPDAVNTEFVLDMQRKLFRWSDTDADKVFMDLFNLVSDRRTLEQAWRRLSTNTGSRTPGTDGVTRRSVERQEGGVARFVGDLQQELKAGTTNRNLSANGSSRRRASPASSGHSASRRSKTDWCKWP
jgi:hypothetical protein